MTEPVEDFATLFAASIQAKRHEKGQVIEGKVVAIGADVAFIDVGGKGEATIGVDELKNDEGQIEVAVGDRVQAMVVATDGGLKLSRKLARGAATDRQIEDAYRAGLPVEGKVEKAVKGGYEVRVGRQRAFCPLSQIDTLRAEATAHEGRTYEFRIIEYREGGKNIILSRRALLEEAQQAVAVEVRKSIVVGAVLTGRVASVREFGAFIDLGGGVQGLLHVSEMGWSRVTDAAQVVKPGEEITVKVLRIDEGNQRIALGLKQMTADPWSRVQETYKVGAVCTGRVTRVAEFGAFVELEPGVEALAHVSTFPPTGRKDSWRQLVTPDTTAAFEILNIDLDQKRIGVALVPEGSARARSAAQGEIVPGARIKGKVERHEKFGVFVFLAPGRTGVIPMSETGVAKEGDVAKALPVGAEVEVIVLEVDPAGRRIRLSIKAIADAQAAEELREYKERATTETSSSFGSLADKLRGALDSKKS
jgi:small subunit ribosomal protein S1